MTVCISNEIQFLCPVATATTCGITLWAFSNNHLFGTAYKDILKAMDRIRQWRIDPTKHFQSEVHNLMLLIERANETNDNTMPDKNILAILYGENSKDPREALRITALNCQDEVLTTTRLGPNSAACFCRSGTNEQDRENTLNGIQNSNTFDSIRFQVNKCPLFSISGKQMSLW